MVNYRWTDLHQVSEATQVYEATQKNRIEERFPHHNTGNHKLFKQVNQWTPLLPVVTLSNSDKTHAYSNFTCTS